MTSKDTALINGTNGYGGGKNRLKKLLRFRQKRLAFPYGVIVAIFVIIPLLFMMMDAFRGADGSFTLSNFDKFWALGEDTKNLWLTIRDTFLLALFTTIICLLFAYPLALALLTLRTNKKVILVLLFVAPMWINSLLRIYAIKLLFDSIEYRGFWLVLVGMVYDFFPFMLLPIYTSLAGTDKTYFEAAGDLGASPIMTLLKVKLQLSKQGIISGIIMVFMPAMSTFAISGILSNGTVVLFGNLIEMNVLLGAAKSTNIGSAYSLVLLFIMAITFFVANRFARISGESRAESVI